MEQAWEKEAKDQGMNIEQLAKNLEEDYTWEEKTISRAEHTLPQEAVIEDEEKREPKKDKKLRIDVKPRVEKRFSALSIDEDQFVDALTSPLIDKPKDSGEFPRDGDDRG